MVEGLGFRIYALGFRVEGSGLRVWRENQPTRPLLKLAEKP